MKDTDFEADKEMAFRDVGVALGDLRDALVNLSLLLRDWQFETDLQARKNTDDVVQTLLKKISAD